MQEIIQRKSQKIIDRKVKEFLERYKATQNSNVDPQEVEAIVAKVSDVLTDQSSHSKPLRGALLIQNSRC